MPQSPPQHFGPVEPSPSFQLHAGGNEADDGFKLDVLEKTDEEGGKTSAPITAHKGNLGNGSWRARWGSTNMKNDSENTVKETVVSLTKPPAGASNRGVFSATSSENASSTVNVGGWRQEWAKSNAQVIVTL